MAKKRKNDDAGVYDAFSESSERDRAISVLEGRRAGINREIEKVLRLYAKASKHRHLIKRKYKLGKAPSDQLFAKGKYV